MVKIHRLREVKVLTGFTRLEAPEPEIDEQAHIVKLKCGSGEKWLPAVEINGEGVFIELNREKLINGCRMKRLRLVQKNIPDVMRHTVKRKDGKISSQEMQNMCYYILYLIC